MSICNRSLVTRFEKYVYYFSFMNIHPYLATTLVFHHSAPRSHLRVAYLEHRLTMASTSEHGQERLVSLLNAFKLSIARLDLSLRNPLGHSSLEVLNVVSVDIVIPEDEALDLDASAEDL